MRVKRSILGVVTLFACALAAAPVAGPAQAAPSPGRAGGHVLAAPTAPRAAHSVSPLATPASAPAISPSVTTGHVAPNGSYTCGSGTLCSLAWDPTRSDWKIFHLHKCARYSLSDWTETGYYFDAQTGGVRSHFYGRTGNTVKSFTPDQTQHSQDWTPVWSIRNC
jgi:hypothetical protein